MRRLLSLAALSAVAVLSVHAAAADEVKVKGPWDGLGVGSYVHQKSTTTMSGVPGMENAPPQVSETKQTLVKVTDEAYIIKSETKMGAEWQGTEMPYPRKVMAAKGEEAKAPKREDLGEEKVTVEGTEIACKKWKSVAEGSTTTTWENDKYGVVKSETAAGGMTMSTVLTKLAGKTKIGSTEVEYREMTSTSKSDAQSSKTVMWSSDAVPGGFVRMEMTSQTGPMKTSLVTETVAFEKRAS